MPSYVPEYVYGFTGWDERGNATYGLVEWPEYLKPRPQVELTKKGEAYVQAALAETGGVFFLTLDARDRTSIATTIERLINLLDDMEGDPDLEPYLAGAHGGDRFMDLEGDDSLSGDCDREPSLGWTVNGEHGMNADFASDWGDLEEECEDEGACIQSQPHDDEGDAEPFLGWIEQESQGRVDAELALGVPTDADENGCGHLNFHGEGYHIANQLLRGAGRQTVRGSTTFLSENLLPSGRYDSALIGGRHV